MVLTCQNEQDVYFQKFLWDDIAGLISLSEVWLIWIFTQQDKPDK